MNVRQSEITALVAIGQPRVINAEQMQNRGVEVMNVHRAGGPLLFRWLRRQGVAIRIHDVIPVVVRLAVGDSGFDATSCHPDGKAAWMVIASIVVRT